MYDSSDPRAALAPVSSAPVADHFAGAEYGRFWQDAPHDTDGGRNWYIRGQNFVLHYAEAQASATFARKDQADEYVVLLPDAGTEVEIESGGERRAISGRRIAFVPPGDSVVRVTAPGRVVRLVSAHAADLVARCGNAASYGDPHPNVALLEAWPQPTGGYAIRDYPIDVPATPGRFGTIYRCTTFMVNLLDLFEGPRDATKMSPHHHDDFEQCSLALEGEFVHYLRWPWTTNLNQWREDDKERFASPSVAVIPPPAIHTSRAVGEGTNRLIDIFSPPRIDFSEKAGWVLNADDYPMPAAGRE